MHKQVTFLWHDYETFGANPRLDRPSQFGAIRTDADLNPIGEPEMFFCTPADDFLPHPMAVLITGITPQIARTDGFAETEFAGRINELMSQPNTCVVGYNSLRFDDEVTRHLFYRNFIDPYGREWQNGNSRWDLIDVVRAIYALRPEGINWPRKEDGSPSFKLEDLTAANGIEHGESAHDALADVYATIELARLLKRAQPRMFEHLFNMRGKQQVAKAIDLDQPKPLLHISSRFPASRGCAAIVLPLARHPSNPNGVIVYDLSENPQELMNLTAAEIAQRVFVSSADLDAQGLSRIPLKLIHLNRCPIVLPVKAMEPTIAERHGIDLALNESHWQQLKQLDTGFLSKIQQVFADGQGSFKDEGDPDLMLYSGAFFSANDKQNFQQIRNTSAETLEDLALAFEDPRCEEMLFRFRARNWPEYLTSNERERWDEFRWQRFHSSVSSLTLKGLEKELMRLSQQALDDKQIFLLQEVQLWVESMLPLQFME